MFKRLHEFFLVDLLIAVKYILNWDELEKLGCKESIKYLVSLEDQVKQLN